MPEQMNMVEHINEIDKGRWEYKSKKSFLVRCWFITDYMFQNNPNSTSNKFESGDVNVAGIKAFLDDE